MFFANYMICITTFILFWQQVKSTDILSSMDPAERMEFRSSIRMKFTRGMILGLFNLIAFASLLKALVISDASIVIPIYSLYVVVPVLFSALLQNYVLTTNTVVAVVLSIAAIIMLQ